MSNFKRNYLPGRVAPFDSSKRFARDRIMNNVNDAMEGNTLSVFKRARFKAVILNGYETGILKSTGDGYFFNAPVLVDLGEGLSRWKVKFVIHEDFYDTNIGNAFTSFYGNSPLLANTPPALMQQRIDRMPFAYTDIGNSFYGNLHFGAIVNVYERFGYFFVGNPVGTQAVGGYSGAGSARGGFSNGTPFSTPESGGQLPEPEQAPQFVVEGVRYVSVPATNAAARAAALYNSAKGAGMTDKSKKWETTPEGRAWISTHIYDGLFPGKGNGAKYGPLLGVKGKESHWSSWFHNMCHKPYKKPFKGKGAYKYIGYPGVDAYGVKKQVEANPSAFIGQQIFGLFNPTDVPIFAGDSLFNFGSHGKRQVQNSYDSFKGDVSGVGSHMRVVAVKQGGKITCHGGNEGQKVGNKTFSLDGDKLHKDHHKRFAGVYKKVKVIGPA